MIVLGILLFLGITHINLTQSENAEAEEIFIFPKIVYSAMAAYAFAAIADSIFKINDNGKFIITGITFYGGLFGGIIGMYIQLHISRQKNQYTVSEWFNTLTQPLIVFHIVGRIGCFLAGCCYGKVTSGFWGVAFPDNITDNIFHNGQSRYPTQLFEVTALILILIIIHKEKDKFNIYIFLYAISRFIIEFFRGDSRGNLFIIISPAQLISLVIIVTHFIKKVADKKRKDDL